MRMQTEHHLDGAGGVRFIHDSGNMFITGQHGLTEVTDPTENNGYLAEKLGMIFDGENKGGIV